MKVISFDLKQLHCLKSVQIQSYFRSVFSCIPTKYEIYSVNLRIQSECRKIRTRNNSVFGHFSRSVHTQNKAIQKRIQYKVTSNI